jgi:cobalt-zinc-cadmium efflux system protein
VRSALWLTLAFVAVEALFGWFGPSLALLSDAGHNLQDAVALGFAWYALSIAERRSHHGMTFGYHRVSVLAALVNAVSLAGIALLIGFEAIDRIREPAPANGPLMIGVAAVAIAVNIVNGLWLRAGARHDINIRGAYLHQLGEDA